VRKAAERMVTRCKSVIGRRREPEKAVA
jgi:hypothetical protein